MKPQICFVLCMLFCSCSKNESPVASTPTQNGVIVPLAKGNYWVGRVFEFDTSGNTTASYYDTIKVFSDSGSWGENQCWVTNRPNTLWSNSDVGLLEWNSSSPPVGATPYLIARYPCRDGEVFSTGFDHVARAVNIPGVGKAIEGKGTFPEIYYWTRALPPRPALELDAFCPNIGPSEIKKYYYTLSGAMYNAYAWELVDYSLK